jgi:single-stranded-DNA-specific exonuclease
MRVWKILNEAKDNDFIDLLLENRGISTQEDKEVFLNPPSVGSYIKKLPNDFKKSLKDAKKRIEKAIKNNQVIVIYGDYDADGVCATAILFKTVKFDLGYERVLPFIPNRFSHGYGLSVESIDDVIKKSKDTYESDTKNILFITVDTGITAVDEIDYVKSLGCDIIVTDHHQKPDTLPSSDITIWSDKIVGSSISWLLSMVLGSQNKDNLSYACLATVTDLQPLTDFNRTIVKDGLVNLNTSPPVGIKALLDISGRRGNEITTYDLGWVIGPRVNAGGRLKDASEALALLLESDNTRAGKIAARLNRTNIERQEMTTRMYDLASVEQEEIPKIIITYNEDFHEGIIGLVASKLVQTYFRPSVVISLEGEMGKGSVRSIPGIDIISILQLHKHLFEKLGGHKMAAGFSIKTEKIPLLEEELFRYFNKSISDDVYKNELKIDLKIPLELVDFEFVEKIEHLKPYGLGNPEPKFLTENVTVVGIDWVGSEDQHLKLKITSENTNHKSIMFNAADMNEFKEIVLGDKLDIVYKVKINDFKGGKYLDLILIDIKKSRDL